MFGRKPTAENLPPDVNDLPPANDLVDAPPEIEALWSPTEGTARKSVEQLLLERGQIQEEHLTQAKQVQSQTPGKTITQILLTMNSASEAQILSAQAETLGLIFEVPEKAASAAEAFALLPPDYIRKHLVLPIRVEDKTLIVGMADPTNVFLIDEVKRKVKRDVRIVVTPGVDINRLVEQITTNAVDLKVDEIIKDMAEDDVQVVKEEKESEQDLTKLGNESPIIRFVNYLIFDACKQGASDIHIEPKEKALKIRYRIDGVLFESMNPPANMHAAVVSRLKIMANLDIAERRLPQDGRIRAVVNGRKIDLRMSTLPTANGEKCVMRILDNRSI